MLLANVRLCVDLIMRDVSCFNGKRCTFFFDKQCQFPKTAPARTDTLKSAIFSALDPRRHSWAYLFWQVQSNVYSDPSAIFMSCEVKVLN